MVWMLTHRVNKIVGNGKLSANLTVHSSLKAIENKSFDGDALHGIPILKWMKSLPEWLNKQARSIAHRI
ncbi:MAG: hypothetical protein R2728_04055 [Chitinophagales bacterium]